MPVLDACETRLATDSTALLETARDIGLQQESLRTNSHPPQTKTLPTSFQQPPLQCRKHRATRRLPWLLAGSEGLSRSASTFYPPSSFKQGQVLGKRRTSVG